MKNNGNGSHKTILIFAIIAAVFSMLWFVYSITTTERAVTKALYKLETLKAWGQANWDNLQKLYSDPEFAISQRDQINDALNSIGNAPSAGLPEEKAPDNTVASTTLSEEEIASVLDYPTKGGNDSDIVYVEYTDFECPFCQSHFDNGITDTLIETEGIDVIYKNFPLSMHPLAQKSAEWSLCAWHLGGDDPNTYYEYVTKVFESKDSSVENITSIAVDLGVNEDDFIECLDSGRYAGEVANQMNEAQSLFGVNGTPGNVLINKKTGKYETIPGAQPLSSFTSALKRLQ